ncbi:MAG: nucleotidyltransferase domain-containing protein [Parcubacteria group bacterium]|nr:nucleotidyltransferase domain-containing protein [Parcubacteria group bacterium]
MPTRQIETIVKKYADTLKKNNISFTNIYLFGSYAVGKAKPYSDIDVAIVVDKIKSGRDYIDRKMKLWELTPEVDVRIEPILIEKTDIEQGGTTMASEVKKYGVLMA